MSQAYFIAGTDTDVGKTTIAAGLCTRRAAGHEHLGGKPVASGCDDTQRACATADALALIDESTIKLPYEQVNPFAFEPAIAPHLAAREAGVRWLTVQRCWRQCASAGSKMPISP